MERSLWMYNLSRLDPSYIPEVHRFVDAAKNHVLKLVNLQNLLAFISPLKMNIH